jgi:hypothetical protein
VALALGCGLVTRGAIGGQLSLLSSPPAQHIVADPENCSTAIFNLLFHPGKGRVDF